MLASYVLVVICFCLFFGVFIFTSDKKLKSFVFSFLFFALNFLVATWLIYLELAMVVGAGVGFATRSVKYLSLKCATQRLLNSSTTA